MLPKWTAAPQIQTLANRGRERTFSALPVREDSVLSIFPFQNLTDNKQCFSLRLKIFNRLYFSYVIKLKGPGSMW